MRRSIRQSRITFLYYRKAPGLCNIHKVDDKKVSYYDKKVQAAF